MNNLWLHLFLDTQACEVSCSRFFKQKAYILFLCTCDNNNILFTIARMLAGNFTRPVPSRKKAKKEELEANEEDGGPDRHEEHQQQ